ncbi:MAG: response regulator transcription factor [Pyrinomonadaceae bacterium]
MRRRGGDREATTVFIIAASDVVRAGLESLIANDARFTVAGSAADLSELASEGSERPSPDIVIFDAERQQEERVAALRSFTDEADEGEQAPAFVVIGAQQSEWLTEALRAGIVRATLRGAASGGEIIAAVEAVSFGLVALDAEMLPLLLPPTASVPDELRLEQTSGAGLSRVAPELDALTPREHEVLEMIALGLSNKEIAWRMKISEHTVKFHIASIFAKLDVSSRTEAVMRGIRRGLIMM